MTPAESEDLKEEARGLIYWGQVPVHVTIGDTEFTTALFPRDGAGMTGRWNCGSLTARSSRSRWSSSGETPRTTWEPIGVRSECIFAEASRQRRGSARVGVRR